MKFKKNNYRLTEKGIATLAAIDSGLLPKVEGGWDDTTFNKFWDLFCEMRNKHSSLQLSPERKDKARERNKKA